MRMETTVTVMKMKSRENTIIFHSMSGLIEVRRNLTCIPT